MVTVLIFSCNRHGYLKRAIAYWALSDLPVVIADGSEKSLECDFPANVDYLHRPSTSLSDRLAEMAQRVRTRYVVLCPDDDFVGFNGLRVAAEFLYDNPDCASAQGWYVRFEAGASPSKVYWSWDCRHASRYMFMEESPELRLLAAMKPPLMHYCYSVMTALALRKSLALLHGVAEVSISTFELSFIPGLLCSGKHVTLPIFFGARQTQPRHWGTSVGFEDWVARNSSNGYDRWRANICKLLEEDSSLSREESDRVVSAALSTCLDNFRVKNPRPAWLPDPRLRRTWRAKLAGRLTDRQKNLLRPVHAPIRSLWHLYRMFGISMQGLDLFRRDWRRIRSIVAANPVGEANSGK